LPIISSFQFLINRKVIAFLVLRKQKPNKVSSTDAAEKNDAAKSFGRFLIWKGFLKVLPSICLTAAFHVLSSAAEFRPG
jgi:hypothetical protein